MGGVRAGSVMSVGVKDAVGELSVLAQSSCVFFLLQWMLALHSFVHHSHSPHQLRRVQFPCLSGLFHVLGFAKLVGQLVSSSVPVAAGGQGIEGGLLHLESWWACTGCSCKDLVLF